MQGKLSSGDDRDRENLAFENVVERFYQPLYQFAFSLTFSEADACDLTQQTLYIWRLKGGQLRDHSKVRAWLFTTLHRSFLQSKRREKHFPHYELSSVDSELPSLYSEGETMLDCNEALDALAQIDEVFRTPLALFYLEDCQYKEIADILRVPLGTVKSRISRGILQLQKILLSAPRELCSC